MVVLWFSCNIVVVVGQDEYHIYLHHPLNQKSRQLHLKVAPLILVSVAVLPFTDELCNPAYCLFASSNHLSSEFFASLGIQSLVIFWPKMLHIHLYI